MTSPDTPQPTEADKALARLIWRTPMGEMVAEGLIPEEYIAREVARHAQQVREENSQRIADLTTMLNLTAEAAATHLKRAMAAEARIDGAREKERERLRGNVFSVLRTNNVSDECFAEVAMVTHAANSDLSLKDQAE